MHTHVHTSETSDSACRPSLPPQQRYETEEYPEMGNQSVSSSRTGGPACDLISQFPFPCEVVSGKQGGRHGSQGTAAQSNTSAASSVKNTDVWNHFPAHQNLPPPSLCSLTRKRKLRFLQDTLIGNFTLEQPLKGKTAPTFGKYYHSLFIDY